MAGHSKHKPFAHLGPRPKKARSKARSSIRAMRPRKSKKK